MYVKYNSIFHSKAFQNIPKLGLFVRKYVHLLATPERTIEAIAQCDQKLFRKRTKMFRKSPNTYLL
jgi:hypothetical protein